MVKLKINLKYSFISLEHKLIGMEFLINGNGLMVLGIRTEPRLEWVTGYGGVQMSLITLEVKKMHLFYLYF